jgi:hypothetical protein
VSNQLNIKPSNDFGYAFALNEDPRKKMICGMSSNGKALLASVLNNFRDEVN